MQLEQLAEKVVGVADVTGVIDQRGEGGVALDDILAAEGLACLEPGAGLADAVDGGGELVDGVLVGASSKKSMPSRSKISHSSSLKPGGARRYWESVMRWSPFLSYIM